MTVDACLRQLDFLGEELGQIDALIAKDALQDPDIQRLMTIPGVDVTTAATLVAVIGDVHRFPTAKHLAGYLGLTPRVRQSGNAPARHGRILRRDRPPPGTCSSRRHGSPLALRDRCARSRCGPRLAVGSTSRRAVARKLAVLCWHLLTRGEDYAFQRPSLVRRKLRALELKAGAPREKLGPNSSRTWNRSSDGQERQIAEQAETAYRRLVTDWQTTRPKDGASATPERAC